MLWMLVTVYMDYTRKAHRQDICIKKIETLTHKELNQDLNNV